MIKVNLTLLLIMACSTMFLSTANARDDLPSVKKADKTSIKKLETALKDIHALGIDFTSNDITVKKTNNGVKVSDLKAGITITETKIGPYIHTLKGKLIATGVEAVVIRDIVIGAVFEGSYSRDDQEYEQVGNSNHPPPCSDCHPCPEGMNCGDYDPTWIDYFPHYDFPPSDDEEEEEGGCDPLTDLNGCQSDTECDPLTDPNGCQSDAECDELIDPDGCECPQEAMGLTCDEDPKSLLNDFNTTYY